MDEEIFMGILGQSWPFYEKNNITPQRYTQIVTGKFSRSHQLILENATILRNIDTLAKTG